jgi:hypothetical protein
MIILIFLKPLSRKGQFILIKGNFIMPSGGLQVFFSEQMRHNLRKQAGEQAGK